MAIVIKNAIQLSVPTDGVGHFSWDVTEGAHYEITGVLATGNSADRNALCVNCTNIITDDPWIWHFQVWETSIKSGTRVLVPTVNKQVVLMIVVFGPN